MTSKNLIRRWKRWMAVAAGALAVAVVGGPYLYFHFIAGAAPPPLTLATPSATTGVASGGLAGEGVWTVSPGSVVGYRVKETLFGQSNVAVGRTSVITGSITVGGTTITAASFTVDMGTVQSDESRRDDQFRGRIMDTSTYPTATFVLTEPIELGSRPAQGAQVTAEATGKLTLHGVTRTVTFDVTGQYTGSTIQVAGSIPITFSDWNVDNPSFGPAQTEDHGVLEFLLDLTAR